MKRKLHGYLSIVLILILLAGCGLSQDASNSSGPSLVDTLPATEPLDQTSNSESRGQTSNVDTGACDLDPLIGRLELAAAGAVPELQVDLDLVSRGQAEAKQMISRTVSTGSMYCNLSPSPQVQETLNTVGSGADAGLAEDILREIFEELKAETGDLSRLQRSRLA